MDVSGLPRLRPDRTCPPLMRELFFRRLGKCNRNDLSIYHHRLTQVYITKPHAFPMATRKIGGFIMYAVIRVGSAAQHASPIGHYAGQDEKLA